MAIITDINAYTPAYGNHNAAAVQTGWAIARRFWEVLAVSGVLFPTRVRTAQAFRKGGFKIRTFRPVVPTMCCPLSPSHQSKSPFSVPGSRR